ncbi:MAG: Gfo/Idh/MocA family oxidoreductase [Chloroflexota bacterium]
MRRAKIASVGCGIVARRWHLPTIAELAKHGDIEHVAICDMDKAIAREVGQEYGVPHYTNVEEMLDRHPDTDVLDIATGDYTHHVIAKMAAERKVHVLVEKPMAPTLALCDFIIDSCQKNGVHYEVAENYFRMPGDRVINKLITEGILGDIRRVHFVEPFRQLPYVKDAGKPRGIESPVSYFRAHSGICIDMGVHRMSQLRLAANSEPKKIVAITKQFNPGEDKVFEDFGHAMLEFESGAVGVYETSLVGEQPMKYRHISGTKGNILDLDYFKPDYKLRLEVKGEMQDVPIERQTHSVNGMRVLTRLVVHTEPEIVYENPFRGYAIDDWNIGTAEEIMTIANAAVNDTEPEYGIGGRKDVELCIALYESSLQGMMPVELPITQMTQYEQMVYDDYRAAYGLRPDEV